MINLTRNRRKLIPKINKYGKFLNNSKRGRIYKSISKQLHKDKKTNIVVNLSDRYLSLIEKDVLNKGLNFCITNNNKKSLDRNIETDITQFTRTLQIKFMFDGEDDNEIEKFTGNPDWKPPNSKCSPAIAGYTDYLQKEIQNLVKINKVRHNVSRKEREALKSLRDDVNILIQKADKGGSIVVLNTNDYVNKMLNMLNDPVTYTETATVDLNAAKVEIDRIIFSLYANEYISKKQKNFLTRNKPKLPILYGLPKIHKKDCPIRPIVSQIDSPAYKLNKYLDYLLTTAEKCIPNLLQDTTKFLQIINTLDALPENCILFTIDVTSLYTVLPHDLVINYVVEMYTETLNNWHLYTPDIRPIPPTLLKEIICIILNQTFFSFRNKTYIQNYGITMGAPSSVKLANIALFKHLEKTLNNYRNKLPLLQLRLIDDIFGIWSGTKNELLEWVTFLNSSHSSIKFTLESSETEIPFLDTTVYIENNKVKTKLYKKPTDNKQYLHYNSEHPKHVKNAIPYAQALRFRRIIEDDSIFKIELEKLKDSFLDRLYPEKVLNLAIDRVSKLNRLDTIQYNNNRTSKEFNATPLILTFNNALVSDKNLNIYKLLTKSWENLLNSAPTLSSLLAPKVVFRKSCTISQMLVSAVFPPPRWASKSTLPQILPRILPERAHVSDSSTKSQACNARTCKTCKCIVEANQFHSTVFDKCFPIDDVLNCNSCNIIYLITCLKCKIQYVGETGNALRDRMNGHRSCVKLNKDTPVGIHFNSKNHDLSHLSVVPIEKLKSENLTFRRSREFFWQHKLGTIFPRGLNNFPVEKRELFKNLYLTSFTDLDLFWSLTNLENNSDSDS